MPTSPDPPESVIPDGEATGLRMRIVDAAVASARHPLVVIAIAAALAALSVVYVARNFAIDTDSAKLISAKVEWRVRSAAFDAAFPQHTDLIAIVVDGATPDLAERASATLAAALAARSDLFHVVRRPDGGPFFEKNGLLFLDRDEVARTTEQLVSSQPVIGTLAADPSIRGLIDTLRLALEGVKRKEASLGVLGPGLAALATTLEQVIADKPASLPWRAMLGGGTADARELRRFVLAQPVLDYRALEPGARASDFIRKTAVESGFDAAHGVHVRLTGNIPMADEEFGTLEEHAGRNATVMLCALLGMLWLAVRSLRAVVAIFATLFVGLALTGAIGLAIYHALNLISVAFAVLFVGLGVDFGIQYAVSYRANAVGNGGADPRRVAVRRAAEQVGTSLALAAAAIAAGFFAFEPTDYRGVSELGVIAGIGMAIAFAFSVTLLPALLCAMRVDGLVEGMHFGALATVDRLLQTHRRRVLAIAAMLAIASLALLPFVRFDFNPLHLRSPETEAVATILDLARDPMTTPNTIDVISPSLDAANALAKKISALPEVSHALTLSSFVPADQTAKLALIADASAVLDLTLNPSETKPAPTDDENIKALRDGARDLAQAANDDPNNAASADARRVAAAFDALADGTPAHRKALDEALIPGLKTTLAQLRSVLGAAPVTAASLPKDLVDDWIAKDGRARIEVFPKQGSGDNRSNRLDPDDDAAIERFIAAVRGVAPDATGTPISIQESANTIVRAFIEAGVWALIAIALLLVFVLRRARDVAITLASLLLGGFVTLGICVVLRIPLNYANIIALPLLFGIGVAFNIYFVIAWRHGVKDLLQTSIARAVIFSALTTSTAFGSLWLSSHPGTASMGKLLALSLACTLAAALLVLPALLGPPERKGANRRLESDNE
jgi:hopanoid biosynthesis associated RND transporter like protein HpnN